MLINDILDLSKIESGTVVVDVGELRLADLHGYVERTFRHVAESKGVDFAIELDPTLPQSIFTDAKRLQQVIKNLLSNAFKFTHQGQVAADASSRRAAAGARRTRSLNRAADRAGLLGVGHRHRHPAGQAADHLRGVPAGRRQHQPQVRRHRAWAWRSAARSRACWAARSAWSARPAGAARSRSICRRPTCRKPREPPPAPSTDGRRRRRRLGQRRSHAAGRLTPPTGCRIAAEDAAARQRGRRRPRRHPARRPRAADRRERPRASPASCWRRPARRASRAWSRRSAPPPWR